MAIDKCGETNADARFLPIDDDCLTAGYIHKRLQGFDLGLFATKWFDYRHLTPVQATRLYISEFEQVYRAIFAREFDRSASQYIRPIRLDDVLLGLERNSPKHKAIFTACWRGRQIADALGMPYKIYLELAYAYRLRRWKRPHMPQPQHLYHEYDVEKIQARWEEMQGGNLYLSEHPAYLVQNYQNVGHQNDYHEWLFKQANLRANPAYYLASFVGNDQLLLSKIDARVDPNVSEMVRSYLQ